MKTEQEVTHYASGVASRPRITILTPGPPKQGQQGGQGAAVDLLPREQRGPSVTPQAHVHFLNLFPHAFGKILTLLAAGVPEEVLRDPRVRPLTIMVLRPSEEGKLLSRSETAG